MEKVGTCDTNTRTVTFPKIIEGCSLYREVAMADGRKANDACNTYGRGKKGTRQIIQKMYGPGRLARQFES
jgi:hypothetical protein